MKKFNAIIFDFDGVLADTMNDLFLAWQKTFKDYGIEIQREDYFPLEGMKLIEIAKKIIKKYNLDISNAENIVNLKNKYYLENNSFHFYSGVNNLVDKLKEKGLLLAIVSASPKEKLEKTIPGDFFNKFNVVLSGDDTKQGKPSPEPYLTAMKKLKVNPKECVVVENAPLGIKSAKLAGAYCIALTTTLDKRYLREADKILNDVKELKSFFL